MSENRYAPPAAPVADMDATTSAPDRTRNVILGAWTLWAITLIGLPVFLYDWLNPPAEVTPGIVSVFYNLTMVILLGVIVFGAWATWMAWKGWNWARIVQLLFLLLGLALSYWIIPANFNESTVRGVFAVVTMLLNVVAIVLWYTPSANAWYRAMKETRG